MKKFIGASFLLSFILFPLFSIHSQTFTFTQDLHRGSRGSEVTALQQILISQGYLHIDTPTGVFGDKTYQALIEYQTVNHNVLDCAGVTASQGYFGRCNRDFLNSNPQLLLPVTLSGDQNTTSSNSSGGSFSNTNELSSSGQSNDYGNLPGPLPTIPNFSNTTASTPPGFNSGATTDNQTNSPTSFDVNQNVDSGSLPPSFTADPANSDGIFMVNVPLLQSYKSTGDCWKYPTTNTNSINYYRNCPEHTSYPIYWTHQTYKHPNLMASDLLYDRKCAMHPVIAYLRDELIPYFPGAYDLSDCRIKIENGNDNSPHLTGKALDIKVIDKEQGDKIILELSQPKNNILGLSYMIFYAKSYSKNPNGVWSGGKDYHGGPGVCKNPSTADNCHYGHVHVQLP